MGRSEAGIRLTLEVRRGADLNFGPDFEVASDMAVLIYDGPVLLGWADDYGTVTHPDHVIEPPILESAEQLVEAAGNLWSRLADAKARSGECATQAPLRGTVGESPDVAGRGLSARRQEAE